jgi:hypothetical protein
LTKARFMIHLLGRALYALTFFDEILRIETLTAYPGNL